MRILVAEDDAKLRDVLTRGLGSAGYTVDVAARGDVAFDDAGCGDTLAPGGVGDGSPWNPLLGHRGPPPSAGR